MIQAFKSVETSRLSGGYHETPISAPFDPCYYCSHVADCRCCRRMEGILIPSIFYIRGEHMQKYLSTMLKAVLTVVGGVSFLLSCTNEVPGVPSVATIISETIITPPPETVSPSAAGSVEPTVITSDLATSPIPVPTITVPAARATNTPIPSPTVIAPE